MTRSACVLLFILSTALPFVASAQIGLNDLARNVKALDKNFDIAEKITTDC